jgi:hypothetical protein
MSLSITVEAFISQLTQVGRNQLSRITLKFEMIYKLFFIIHQYYKRKNTNKCIDLFKGKWSNDSNGVALHMT